MKKTTLVLAISALLYGTSGTYVFADATDPSSDEILQYLNSTAEDAPTPPPGADGTTGFDPSQALPKNVAVTGSNKPIILSKHTKMCESSFQVNGPAMAEFPITVNGNDVGTWSVVGKKAVVTGNGWKLELPVGDTWQSAWKLTTTGGTVITSILLEPFKRADPDQMKYVFDIGGKFPAFPAPRLPFEHTPDAARGQFIVQTTPKAPPPIFTATYSYPVYTTYAGGHGALPLDQDSTDIPLNTAGNRKPTHDLYSTLLINFPNAGLTGSVGINPGFGFIADTDCLPIQEINDISYVGTTLSFTVVGEGAVAIMEGQKVVQGPFVVGRGDGEGTFTTQFIPTAGSCYNMMDVDTLKVMTKDYCF